MRSLLILAATALPFLTACSGGELVGIHIALGKDGSGTLTTRSLVEPASGQSPAESRSQNVVWAARASLLSAQGRFSNLGDVQIGGGIRFRAQLGDELPRMRAFVKRSPTEEWVKALVPEQAARRAMAKVYDPTGKTAEIGDTVRIELSLPGDVISSGVQPTGRGVEATHERNRAYLLIPVKTALEDAEELVWDISWR